MPPESTCIRVWTQGEAPLNSIFQKMMSRLLWSLGTETCAVECVSYILWQGPLLACAMPPPHSGEVFFFHHVLRYQTNPTLYLSSAAPLWCLASFGCPKSQMFCSWLRSGTRDREIGQPCTLRQRSCERLQKAWSGCTCGLLALLSPTSQP